MMCTRKVFFLIEFIVLVLVAFTYTRVSFAAGENIMEAVGGNYLKDVDHVYYYGNVLEGADAKSFQYVNALIDYGKDDNFVYYSDSMIEDADPKTFQIIGDFFAKDKNNVYFSEELIKDADPRSFVHVYADIAKDKNNFYLGEKVLSTNSNLLFLPGCQFVKDKRAVYSIVRYP